MSGDPRLRPLLRMERPIDPAMPGPPDGYQISAYRPARDHERIRRIFGESFGREPWPSDWDGFPEFDPDGVFVAEEAATGRGVGFAICFRREHFGYVSVVAVVPDHRRRGLASALVGRAARYSSDLGLTRIRIDAWEDSPEAVATYRSLGFRVYERRQEMDDA